MALSTTPQATISAVPTHSRVIRGLILVAIFLLVAFVAPRPPQVSPAGWRLMALFIATIAGLILQPIPGGAVVLCAVVLSTLLGGLTIDKALGGFSDPSVWLVMAAFFISTALMKTGLARRIALVFVRAFGKNSLGVSYALSLTDMVLATIIPSNAARSGGVVLPIMRSISELYGSQPGPSAAMLGTFLFAAVYQNICVTAAMFYTGQASNPLAAQIATTTFHFPVTITSWFLAGIVPGLCSLAIVPLVVYRLSPPEIKHTPQARAFAAEELRKMGGMSLGERIVGGIFIAVCGLWMTSSMHGIDITVIALLGAVGLLLSGILTWEDVVTNRAAWDIFIWYGGLVRLGKALNDTGVTRVFADNVAGIFGGASWVIILAGALLIYFYAHYGFASITAHILAMFPPFAAVLIAKGAPVGLTVFAFAVFSNLAAGLTHYGTTPSPMFYAHGYVPFKTWWHVGFIISLVNIAIWSTVGFWWWTLIGIW